MRLASALGLALAIALIAFAVLSLVAQLSLPVCLIASLLLAYAPSYLDGSERFAANVRFSPRFQHLAVWGRVVSYFPRSRFILECSASTYAEHPQAILAVHPHGVITASHLLLFTDCIGFLSARLTGERRDLAASVLFRVPILRDVLLALGCVDASATTCHRVLRAGLSMQLYVGGEKEQLLTATEDAAIVVAASRKGFIRLACQYDIPVVPCYVFGEDRLYSTSTFLLSVRLALAKSLRVALPLAWGRWGWLPRRVPLVAVVGRPLTFDGEGVGEERVDRALRLYCQHLTQLYERHRAGMGYASTPLQLIG